MQTISAVLGVFAELEIENNVIATIKNIRKSDPGFQGRFFFAICCFFCTFCLFLRLKGCGMILQAKITNTNALSLLVL